MRKNKDRTNDRKKDRDREKREGNVRALNRKMSNESRKKKIWRISAHILSHTDQIIQQNSNRTSENVHIYKIHNECHCCYGGGDSDCHFPLGMVKSYGGNECAEEESTITTTETRCSSIFRNWQKDSCRKKDSRTF